MMPCNLQVQCEVNDKVDIDSVADKKVSEEEKSSKSKLVGAGSPE